MRQGARADKAMRGFTLIELMMGMAISAIVLTVLISVFSQQQKVYSQHTDLAKSQANARAALQMMARDIRMAGYTGIPLGWDRIVATTGIYPILSIKDGSTIIQAPSVAHDTADNLKSSVPGNNVAGSPDAIEIRGNFLRQSTSLAAVINVGESELTVTDITPFSGNGFNQPAWVIVGEPGDPIKVELHTVSVVDTANDKITVGEPFVEEFGVTGGSTDSAGPADVIVSPVFRRVYFLSPGRTMANGVLLPTLYIANYTPIQTSNPLSVILAEGISDFQINYSTASGSQLDRENSMVCDPCVIRNVALTLQTYSEKFRKNQPLLREFSTSVRIRNMGFEAYNCRPVGCTIDY